MALIFTLCLSARRLGMTGLRRVLTTVWPLLVGMVIAPAILAAFFAMKGAWEPFLYGTIRHNLVPDVDARNHPIYLRFVFPVALPFLLVAAAWIVRRAPDTAHAVRRAGLFLFAGFYYTGLYTFWTLLTRQDYLPFFPVAMVLVAPLFIVLAERFLPTRTARVLVAVGGLEIILILAGRPPWIDGTQREREILGEVLRLTKPGEFVMDFKGEAVFRQRAFFYVLEPLTYVRIRSMMIPDTVAERLVATNTCVVLNQDRWYPKNAVRFMAENYLVVRREGVPDKIITSKPVAANESIRFDVAVPASYVCWADGRLIAGSLDGFPATGPRELAAGSHEFKPDAPHGQVAIIAVGRMRVAGKVIAPKKIEANESIRFDVAVPASYVVWADGHSITGVLDGSPATGPRELERGSHEFKPDAAHGPVAIFWSRAADLQFQPVLDKVGWQDFK
jgi:hypothetical protein